MINLLRKIWDELVKDISAFIDRVHLYEVTHHIEKSERD